MPRAGVIFRAMPEAPKGTRRYVLRRAGAKSYRVDYTRELNEEQRAVVFAPDGPTLVVAGAGSGKTRTLVFDQQSVLTQGQTWTRVLTITDPTKPVRVSLVWTDRAAGLTEYPNLNLTNDLDLKVQAIGSDRVRHVWYGNLFYYDRNNHSRTEYSLRDPSPISHDRKNNQ